MLKSNNTTKLGDYNTTINVIGGLRDFDVIVKAIESHFGDESTLKDLISNRNEFDLRTERSRIRIERAVREAFTSFRNQDHEDLIRSVFAGNAPQTDKDLILFWQFSLNNHLFREISGKVFAKVYFSGRTSISKDDIIAYLKEFLNQNKQLELNWSESTIKTLSTKYLNLMSLLQKSLKPTLHQRGSSCLSSVSTASTLRINEVLSKIYL